MQEVISKPKEIRRVLARKYRPKFLKQLIGQDSLINSLTKGINEKRIPQAILLHGIRGTGKTSTARILARAINCLGADGNGDMTTEPCFTCRSCKAIDDDNHLDIIEMDAASHTGVDDIRGIIDSSRYKAVIGRYKVFIIDEVHMLSKSAFNALLKTLEEPPNHVLFIFATTEINKIPETILSRCAKFDLKRVDVKILINHFRTITQQEGYEIENDALIVLARTSEGSVRDGLTLLDQAMNLTQSQGINLITTQTVQDMIGLADKQKLYKILEDVFEKNIESVISKMRGMNADGSDPLMLIQDILECLYRVACFKILPNLSKNETIPEFEKEVASAIAQKIDQIKVLSLWKIMLKGYEDVKKSPFMQQTLEIVMIRCCFAANLPSIDEIIKEHNSTSGVPLAEKYTTPLIEKNATSENEKNAPSTDDKNTPPQNLLHNEFSKISSEQDLIIALEKEREALIISQISKDWAIISIEQGKIVVNFQNENAKKIVGTLKIFLKKITGVNWTIESDERLTNAKTIEQKQYEANIAQKKEVLDNPVIKEIRNTFNGIIEDDIEIIVQEQNNNRDEK